MAQSVSLQSSSSAARLLFGFIAGLVATLIFHQIGLLLLHFVGMTPNMPYNMNSVPPFGVPQFISLSFWGGVWGIIFGAIFPTAVAWFIVRPLKGLPVADVFRVPGISIGPIVNGLWGLGTALFLSWVPGSTPRVRS
jgi:hypothetical protein